MKPKFTLSEMQERYPQAVKNLSACLNTTEKERLCKPVKINNIMELLKDVKK